MSAEDKIKECKRCGSAIAGFLRLIFPEFLSDFLSSTVAPASVLQFCFYSGEQWYPAKQMPNYSAVAKTDSDSVSWHATLFENVGKCVLAQLMFAEREHDATFEDFDTKRMTVCACGLLSAPSGVAACCIPGVCGGASRSTRHLQVCQGVRLPSPCCGLVDRTHRGPRTCHSTQAGGRDRRSAQRIARRPKTVLRGSNPWPILAHSVAGAGTVWCSRLSCP